MALGVMSVGSLAVLVRDDEVPVGVQPPAATRWSTAESRKPIKPKELSGSALKGQEASIQLLCGSVAFDGGPGYVRFLNWTAALSCRSRVLTDALGVMQWPDQS